MRAKGGNWRNTHQVHIVGTLAENSLWTHVQQHSTHDTHTKTEQSCLTLSSAPHNLPLPKSPQAFAFTWGVSRES